MSLSELGFTYCMPTELIKVVTADHYGRYAHRLKPISVRALIFDHAYSTSP